MFLALHSIRKDHEGVYVCEAANDAGVHTEEITVIVGEFILFKPCPQFNNRAIRLITNQKPGKI